MAFKLSEAYVQLSQRGFRGVMGTINRMRGGMGSLTRLAGGPLTAALAGAGAAASGIGMVKLAADLETTTTQFATLLGSADAAKSKIQELQTFAASTPFQFDGLANSARTLLAFGTTSDQIVPTLKVLGDVAAATGSDLGDLSRIFGKVKSRGALMTESLDQFNERGIAIGGELAKMFGTSEAAVRQMASEGKISFGEMQQALQRMASEGGIAFNGMQSQSTTLGGLWSTLKDNMTLALTDIGAAMVDGFDLKTITADFTGFVQRVRQEWMPSIVSGFAWVGENIVTPVLGAIGTVTSIFMDFFGNIDLYWDRTVLTTGNAISNMWQRVSAFFSNMWTLGEWALTSVGTYFVNTWNNLGQVFQNSIEQLKNIWQSLVDFIRTGTFEIDFSPIVDSFQRQTQGIELPELAKAQLDLLQPDIDRIDRQLAQRARDRQRAADQKDRSTSNKGTDALDIDSTTASNASKADEKRSFELVGITQLAEKMQQAAQGNQDKKKEMQLAERNARAAEALSNQASGAGLRVVLAGGTGVTIPSHEFGA